MYVFRTHRARSRGRSPGVKMTDSNARSSEGLSAIMHYLSSSAVTLPRGVPWRERTSKQRLRTIVQATIQSGLLVAALWDLRRRPADQIRGSKRVWALVSCANFLGLGPIAYFLIGRRRRPR
jgi:hypothetical protein